MRLCVCVVFIVVRSAIQIEQRETTPWHHPAVNRPLKRSTAVWWIERLRAVNKGSGSARSARPLGPARFATIAFFLSASRMARISNAKRQTADITIVNVFFIAANLLSAGRFAYGT